MVHKTGTSMYYYNTTLTQSGNYTYRVRALDTSNNQATSNNRVLSLPPNWDVNNDGIYTILDNVLISVRYGQTGSQGWVREDVDNNGLINMVDLVCYLDYYNECWWA